MICDTSALQYLHQVGLLELLPALADRVSGGQAIVPTAVIDELAVGRSLSVDLPVPEDLDWVEVRDPVGEASLAMVTDLGPGEKAVLALALESPGTVAILDDLAARRVAHYLRIPYRGTLGCLLDAKKLGLLQSVGPALEQLVQRGFRVTEATRMAILEQAGEVES